MARISGLMTIIVALAACSEPADQTETAANNEQQEQQEPVNNDEVIDEPVDDPEPEVPTYTKPELVGVATLEDLNADPDIVEVEITAAPVTMDIGDGMMVEMWAYNGQIPGPAINAKVGDEVIVHFKNDLPEETTIHWHGLRISDEMDGNPRIMDPVAPGGTFEYKFEVTEAATYWYHPHVRTDQQLEKGLYGTFVVHDPNDPSYDVERVFVLDDILLDDQGLAPFYENHMVQMHGRLGNVLFTNGTSEQLAPKAEQGHVERWRIVNASNARTMTFGVENAWSRVIGTDGGRITEPFVAGRVDIAVGQRFDLEVHVGETELGLTSYVLTRNDAGNVVTQPIPLAVFDVEATGNSTRTIELPAAPPIAERAVDREVEFVLSAMQGANGIMWMINGKSHNMDEPLFEFQKGETVKMTIVNELGPEHPFHLHGQFFTIVTDGPLSAQPGLRDTVLVPGFSSRTIIAYMDNPGKWMAHCHIGKHAELGMMGEILVNE